MINPALEALFSERPGLLGLNDPSAAGLGRNGTEAAADFVASPHYIQLLQDRLGSDFASQNVEVLLKVNVIDGKTGAPSILAVQTW